jgi:transposase
MRDCVVILYNVPFHRSSTVSDLFNARGHRLVTLPPYSPFLNPIENAFSKCENFVRSATPQNELKYCA